MATRVCSACGTQVQDGIQFCPSCGKFVPEPAATAAPASGPAVAPRISGRRDLQASFRGSAGEYFGIWIVNVLLSIVTLGIYSAWAKVRRLRYFYGNTELDGHTFDYHADPVRILKGRILVVVLIAAYQVLVAVSPFFGVLLVAYAFLLPWAINNALSFNARMTSYRNVRFSFRGDYWRAFGIFVLMPIAIFASLGLLLPVFSRLAGNYVGNRVSFGRAPFRTCLTAGPLFANLGMSVLFALGSAVVLVALSFAMTGAIGSTAPDELGPWLFGMAVAGYGSLLLAAVFYRAGVRNALYAATQIEGGHQPVSRLNRLTVAWISASNTAVTVLTLGLMRPWAAVRSWSYQMDRSGLLAAGSLDDIVGAGGPDGAVAAAEYLDIGGIDLGV